MNPAGAARIALVGDYRPDVAAHRAIPLALARAAPGSALSLDGTWVGTRSLGADAAGRLAPFDGVWCVPGSPYEDTEGALAAIPFARVGGRPFLGICGGFQHGILEYARACWGMAEAAHAEMDPAPPIS
jgi:CTP synthase (UTP-ammonia lyase)